MVIVAIKTYMKASESTTTTTSTTIEAPNGGDSFDWISDGHRVEMGYGLLADNKEVLVRVFLGERNEIIELREGLLNERCGLLRFTAVLLFLQMNRLSTRMRVVNCKLCRSSGSWSYGVGMNTIHSSKHASSDFNEKSCLSCDWIEST
jgi:hypothetical protein